VSQVVGFVGAGRMGEPMVVRLIQAGYRVLLYARRDKVRARLAEQGAILTESPAEVAAADIVLTCLYSDDQLVEVLDGPQGILANASRSAVVVSHTTGTAATITDLDAENPEGPTLVDAPVSGSADDIAAGKITILLGGPEHATSVVEPVLAAYGEHIITTGPTGTALHLKLLNNAVFAATAQLAATAIELGAQLDIDEGQLLRAFSVCSASSYAATSIQNTGSLAQFSTLAAPFLRKDVSACLDTAAASGLTLEGLATTIRTGPLPLS